MYVCIVLCVSVNSYSSLCVRVRVTAFQIHLVRSGPLLETRIRSGFMLVVDPIHKQFEDRSMGWFVDQYQFVQ